VAVANPGDGLEDKSCYPGYSSRVQGAVCFAGFFDFEFYQLVPGDGTLQAQIKDFLGGTYQQIPAIYRQASPTHYVTPDDPPFLLMHGLQDRRVPYEQAPHFAKILEKAEVPVRLIPVNNYAHGHIPGKEPEPSYEVMDQEIYQFFHRHLKEND
jgi:dipeptidyl aminopeptidase/acylaminoacyl peptidase